uniref:WD40 repeat-like protein n=2 Tax=Kalmanozyma brasiliensis (strain GHG001) TaxID=1365824 RepID=V5GKH9_KALBG
MERQTSTGSYLKTIAPTATSSSSHSSGSDNVPPPLSPSMTADLDIPDDSRAKRPKAATPKRKTYAMQFSLDGRYLALAGSDHLIRVYEVISSPCERAVEVTRAQALRAEEAAQRKNASTCSQGSNCMDRSNTKLDVRAGATELTPVLKSTPLHVFAGHSGDILDLSWSKNNFLLSCGSDKTAKLWHPNREDCLCTFTTSAVVSSIDFHPTDDRFFVTGGLDGKLRLWNISARRVQSLTDVPGVITAVAFSSSGAVVCVGTHAGSVLTFACTDSLSYLNAIKVKSAAASKSTQPSKITCIQPIPLHACSPEVKAAASSRSTAPTKGDSEYMIVTSNDSRVRIYSIAAHRLVSRLKATSYVNRNSQIRATTSTDGQFAVSGSDDASIHVWSLASNATLFGNLFSGIKRSNSIVKSGVGDLGDNSTWRSWQAGAGSVRCAIFAPTATAELLAAAEDPLEREKGEKAAVRARIIVSTDDSNAIRVWRCDPLGRLV